MALTAITVSVVTWFITLIAFKAIFVKATVIIAATICILTLARLTIALA